MKDIQAIFLNELAEISLVDLVDDDEARQMFSLQDFEFVYAIRITGKKLSRAQKVLVNSTQAIFIIISDVEVIALVPGSVSEVNDVFIITNTARFSNNSFMSYELTNSPKSISGKQKAIFQFIKCILTSKGTDKFNPTYGGNLQKSIAIPFSSSNPQLPITNIALLIAEESSQFIKNQPNRLPNSEKVKAISIQSAGVDPTDPTAFLLELKFSFLDNQVDLVGFIVNSALKDITG